MGNPARRLATYDDVLRAPENMVAEVIAGVLELQPRPAKPHASAASILAEELGPPFRRGRGGPGGWILLYEPELHLRSDILVPDMAGWRRERMPKLTPDEPYFTMAPDWVCEVLSPRTARTDRIRKLPIYAREQVHHTWLVDPIAQTLEVFRLEQGRWVLVLTAEGEDIVRAEPFEAIELELGQLWSDVDWGEAAKGAERPPGP